MNGRSAVGGSRPKRPDHRFRARHLTRAGWIVGVSVFAAMVSACSSPSVPRSATSTTADAAAIAAVNCPDTWLSTTTPQQLNPRLSHSALSAQVIPTGGLWMGFCLYGMPSSATSNAAGLETLIANGGEPASEERALITEINHGTVIDEPAASTCPADIGETYILLITYRTGPMLRVTAPFFGCMFISNGVKTVSSPGATATLRSRAEGEPRTGPPVATPTTSP